MTVPSLSSDSSLSPARRISIGGVVAGLLFAGVAAVGLTWAKWWPYSHKLVAMLGTHQYPGHSVLTTEPGAAPSMQQAWKFALGYGKSIWPAIVVALFVAAGVETLLPRSLVVRLLRNRSRARAALAGGTMALPSMMCTCCTAPVVVSLRRSGASTESSLAYWLGNPTLNPAVLAFLALVLPWQFVVTRIVVGATLVFGVSVLVARLVDRSERPAPTSPAAPAAVEWRRVPHHYARSLVKLAVVLVPEYAVVVLAVGAFQGWLQPLRSSAATWGVGAVLIAAVAGTLMVIPTGGEIPILTGLAAAGFGAGVAGALLIALPALSLPSMALVGRALSWRVTAAMAGAVAVCALTGGVLLTALT